MVERKHVTLVYKYNENWIGGTYYIINLIKSLNYLPDDHKPLISVCYEGSEQSLTAINGINYPYISFIKLNTVYNFLIKAINFATDKFFKKKWLGKIISIKKIKNLYPASTQWNLRNVENLYFWIPDFQYRYLPQFFSDRELHKQNEYQLEIKNSKLPVVFSSYSALDDYDKFYPGNTNRKEVLQFVSVIGNSYKLLSIDSLREKFNIIKPYFIVSNQFWKHKNHEVLIKALVLLKNDKSLPPFQIIFTGKEYDFRNPDYVNTLKSYIIENQLQEDILFLGFIDRDEQLQLMKNSLAVIQPSFFEGWSTVVEDTKAINHHIIVSDIPLHREQVRKNCTFFDPNSEKDLSEKIKSIVNAPVKVEPVNYEMAIMDFAFKFVSLLR